MKHLIRMYDANEYNSFQEALAENAISDFPINGRVNTISDEMMDILRASCFSSTLSHPVVLVMAGTHIVNVFHPNLNNTIETRQSAAEVEVLKEALMNCRPHLELAITLLKQLPEPEVEMARIRKRIEINERLYR